MARIWFKLREPWSRKLWTPFSRHICLSAQQSPWTPLFPNIVRLRATSHFVNSRWQSVRTSLPFLGGAKLRDFCLTSGGKDEVRASGWPPRTCLELLPIEETLPLLASSFLNLHSVQWTTPYDDADLSVFLVALNSLRSFACTLIDHQLLVHLSQATSRRELRLTQHHFSDPPSVRITQSGFASLVDLSLGTHHPESVASLLNALRESRTMRKISQCYRNDTSHACFSDTFAAISRMTELRILHCHFSLDESSKTSVLSGSLLAAAFTTI